MFDIIFTFIKNNRILTIALFLLLIFLAYLIIKKIINDKKDESMNIEQKKQLIQKRVHRNSMFN